MAKLECPSCDTVLDCCPPSGLDDYLLVGKTYFNQQISLLFQCPQGYSCTPGTYPKLITIPAGEIPWNPPPTPNGLPLTIQCCDGPFTVQYDPNISQTDYVALLQSMVNEAARRLAGCREKSFRPKPKKQTNDAQTVLCPNGDPIANISGLPLSAFLPSSVKISVGGNGLTVKAGTFTVEDKLKSVAELKAAADKQALDFVTAALNKAIADGKLLCGIPVAPCSIFIPDNTSQGQRTMPNGPLPDGENFALSWSGLLPGDYRVDFITGAYQITTGPNLFAVNTNNVPVIVSIHFGTAPFVPPFFGPGSTMIPNSATFPTELLAIADYHALYTGNENTFFVGDDVNDNICMAESSSNAVLGAHATKPIYELVRVQRLIAPQPATLQIQNFEINPVNLRYNILYGVSTSALLTLTETAASLQAALNAMPAIIADGGVTVAVNAAIPNLGSGFNITWNNNGPRSNINPQLTTVSPGIFGQISKTQVGNPGLPEIQTFFMGKRCSFFDDDLIGPAWDGSVGLPNRYLSKALWRHFPSSGTFFDFPIAAPSLSIQNMKFVDAFVYLAPSGLVPSPSGCGWVLVIFGFIGLGSTVSLLWSGVKLTGLTPQGTYFQVDSTQLDAPSGFPWNDSCNFSIAHGVGQITLV